MINPFSILKQFFEKDAVTTVCVLVLIAAFIVCVYFYRKHIRTDTSPDLLEHEGYYKVALTPMGYSITDRNNLFRTLNRFYYLRKDPFNIEVSLDEIKADDGKSYRALALVTVVLPEDRIDYVCKRYFDNNKADLSNAEVMAIMMSGKSKQNENKNDIAALLSTKSNTGKRDISDYLSERSALYAAGSDDIFKQMMRGKVDMSSRRDSKEEKTNCDGDVDMELTIAFSTVLKNLVKEQAGAVPKEELKKQFLAKSLLCAMEAGHAVTNIPTFTIIENTD